MEPSDVAGFLNSIEPSSVQQQQQQAVDTPALNNYSGVNQQQLVNQVRVSVIGQYHHLVL